MGFGRGRRSWARYSLTAWAAVTQLRPSFIPQISPRRASSRRWPVDRPLSSAASRREINSSALGWSELLSSALCVIMVNSQDGIALPTRIVLEPTARGKYQFCRRISAERQDRTGLTEVLRLSEQDRRIIIVLEHYDASAKQTPSSELVVASFGLFHSCYTGRKSGHTHSLHGNAQVITGS